LSLGYAASDRYGDFARDDENSHRSGWKDDIIRLGTDLKTGIFTIAKTPDLIYSKDIQSFPKADWVAGIIIHDSFHPDLDKRGLPFDTGDSGKEPLAWRCRSYDWLHQFGK